jgi:hypothetical protein
MLECKEEEETEAKAEEADVGMEKGSANIELESVGELENDWGEVVLGIGINVEKRLKEDDVELSSRLEIGEWGRGEVCVPDEDDDEVEVEGVESARSVRILKVKLLSSRTFLELGILVIAHTLGTKPEGTYT